MEDLELQSAVLELLGEPAASIEIPCEVSLQYFTCQLKDVGRFCGIELVVEDDTSTPKHLLVSNRHSAVRVTKTSASLPLQLSLGWNRVSIDLKDSVQRAFGTNFLSCRNVVIHPSCRIARVYFEARHFEDTELPQWLRTIPQ